jgi:ABC-type Mn2+/Zn2+ transport system permease subunit
MKLITRKNFISIVCISFTLIVCGKLLLEKAYGFTDKYYTENIFMCFGFSVLITLILSLHFYLQKYPFIPVFIGQYLVTLIVVFLGIWIAGHFTENAPTAYRDMFISVTIPFFFGAAVYYISFFRQIRKANRMLEGLDDET